MKPKQKLLPELTKGVLKENPLLRLALGICPALAVSTSVTAALGMSAAVAAVLLCSNITISALRKVIPPKVRIPANITVIAGYVAIVQMLVKAYAPNLDAALGIYLPLTAVNCILLGRAEGYAGSHGVLASAFDAIGMGAGFAAALTLIAAVRELLGAGSLAGTPLLNTPAAVLLLPPGGFFVCGCMIALANHLRGGKAQKQTGCGPTGESCAGCESEVAA